MQCSSSQQTSQIDRQQEVELMSPSSREGTSKPVKSEASCRDEIIVGSPRPVLPSTTAQSRIGLKRGRPTEMKDPNFGAQGCEEYPQSADESDFSLPARKRSRQKTIYYHDVFKNGAAKQKHTIVEFPKGTDKWYILQCNTHRKRFGLVSEAAQHLRSQHKTGASWAYATAVRSLGVEVLGCDAERAQQNNDALHKSLEAAAKGQEEIHGSSPTHPIARSTTSQQTTHICDPSSSKLPLNDAARQGETLEDQFVIDSSEDRAAPRSQSPTNDAERKEDMGCNRNPYNDKEQQEITSLRECDFTEPQCRAPRYRGTRNFAAWLKAIKEPQQLEKNENRSRLPSRQRTTDVRLLHRR